MGDEQQPPTGRQRPAPGLFDGAEQARQWIGRRAMAEHHIEQNHCRRRIVRLLQQPTVAQHRVDHRMGATPGEQVITQVNHAVAGADPGLLQLWIARSRHIGSDRDASRRMQQLRFETEGATAEECTQMALCRCHRPAECPEPMQQLDRDRWRRCCRHLALRQGDGQVGRLGQRAGAMHPLAGERTRVDAEKDDDDRFAAGLGGGEHHLGHRRRRWFGDQHDHAGGRVIRQCLQPLQHRDAADLGRQIMATGADRLRDARTQPMDA